MKFYITKVTFNTEDGALPYIEGDITLEDTKALKDEILEGLDQVIYTQVEKCVEAWIDEITDQVTKDLDYKTIAENISFYIDPEDYVDYDNVAERVNESYIDYDEIADQVHDLIDYEDIVNRTIEEIKERL